MLPAALGLDARGERGDVGAFGVGVGDAGHVRPLGILLAGRESIVPIACL